MENNIERKNELNKKSNSQNSNEMITNSNPNDVETLDFELELEELKLADSNISLKQSNDNISESKNKTLTDSEDTKMNKNETQNSSTNNPLDNSAFNSKKLNDNMSNMDENTQKHKPNFSEDTQSNSSKKQDVDSKENVNQNSDNIKNTPEKLKNKYEDAKQKINDTKQKDKEVPEKLNQKRDELKQKWDNRPKNLNDFKNRAKNKGSNIKDRAKNGVKNGAKNVANKAKQGVVDAAKNSNIGQAIHEVKDKVEKVKRTIKNVKKTISTIRIVFSTIAASWPIFLVILAFIIIISVVLIVPGIKGTDVEEYSKTDQKILTKIRKIVDEYPGVDAELAMTTIVYPYFSVLWSDDTISYLSPKIKVELENLDAEEEIDDEDYDEDEEDTEDIKIEEEDNIFDDPYLALFRKYNPHRKYLKQIIKKLNEGEGAYVTYLKDTYFNKNKAYKLMLKDSLNQEALIESIIKDIKDNKSLFANYVFKSSICSATMVPAGTVEIDDMLKGNILVDVKVPSCKSSKGVWDCQSVYSNPIPLKKYVFGGTYEEFNSMDVEKTAAQMLAIKSFITQRSKSMGWGVRRDGANYIVAVRNNTNDLVYCDVDLGCKSGTTEVGDGNAKRDPITEQQRAIFESAWEKVSNKYIYDKNNKVTVGAFCQSRSGECSSCTKGSCLSHNELESYSNTNYESIIAMQYSDYSIIEIDGDFANVNIVGDTDCSNASLMEIDDSNFVYYAQTDYPNVSYCGLRQSLIGNGICPRGNTICSHGCGTTSMAMVTATFTQNYSINPLTLNNEVRPGVDCGTYGTNGSSQFSYIANKYGLSYSYKAFNSNIVNDIKQVLDEGALIITSVCGGVKVNGTYTYGPCGGHFIVIRGYEGDSVIISDPFQNGYLKRYKACLVKNNEKCIKHKMSFDSFYNDLRAKGAGIHIIKGTIPFSELQKQNNTVSTTEN